MKIAGFESFCPPEQISRHSQSISSSETEKFWRFFLSSLLCFNCGILQNYRRHFPQIGKTLCLFLSIRLLNIERQKDSSIQWKYVACWVSEVPITHYVRNSWGKGNKKWEMRLFECCISSLPFIYHPAKHTCAQPLLGELGTIYSLFSLLFPCQDSLQYFQLLPALLCFIGFFFFFLMVSEQL